MYPVGYFSATSGTRLRPASAGSSRHPGPRAEVDRVIPVDLEVSTDLVPTLAPLHQEDAQVIGLGPEGGRQSSGDPESGGEPGGVPGRAEQVAVPFRSPASAGAS